MAPVKAPVGTKGKIDQVRENGVKRNGASEIDSVDKFVSPTDDAPPVGACHPSVSEKSTPLLQSLTTEPAPKPVMKPAEIATKKTSLELTPPEATAVNLTKSEPAAKVDAPAVDTAATDKAAVQIAKKAQTLAMAKVEPKKGKAIIEEEKQKQLLPATKKIQKKETELIVQQKKEAEVAEKRNKVKTTLESTKDSSKKVKLEKDLELLDREMVKESSKTEAADKQLEVAKTEKKVAEAEITEKVVELLQKEDPAAKKESIDTKSGSSAVHPMMATFKGKGAKIQGGACDGVIIEKDEKGSVTTVKRYSCPVVNGQCPTEVNQKNCTITVLDTSAFEKLNFFTY